MQDDDMEELRERLRLIAEREELTDSVLAHNILHAPMEALRYVLTSCPQYSWEWVIFGTGEMLNGFPGDAQPSANDMAEYHRMEAETLRMENEKLRAELIRQLDINSSLIQQLATAHSH